MSATVEEHRQLVDGNLDELVMPGCQLERLDDGHLFVEFTRPDGTSVAIWLYSETPIEATWEER